jgi:organic radical activating enzyme
MATFSEKFFCPAPWSMLYYHANSPSPCHYIKNLQLSMTPAEYFNSDWLKQMKKEMIEGTVPLVCAGACKAKEDLGLKSTRGAIWNYYNVGPEPKYEDQWFANKFTADSPTVPTRIELRFSNLCNMKCRMCDETSSSAFAAEKLEHNIKPDKAGSHIEYSVIPIVKTETPSIEGLKDKTFLSSVRKVCLTGGEPFLIKEYYDYLDYLIENKFNEQMEIELYTNCSVFNPLFIDRLSKFKNVELVMSLDSVGKTAEYIRSGTDWPKVESNVHRLNQLPAPFKVEVTTAISAYSLLDFVSHSEFLMELYSENNAIGLKCYNVTSPPGMHFNNLPKQLRSKAIDQIDRAVEILTAPNYLVLRTELLNVRKVLVESTPHNPIAFFDYTKKYDVIRDESFQEVFSVNVK